MTIDDVLPPIKEESKEMTDTSNFNVSRAVVSFSEIEKLDKESKSAED